MFFFSGYSIPNQFHQLPMKKQAFTTSPDSIQQLQQLYRAHSSSTNDLSPYDYQSQCKFSIEQKTKIKILLFSKFNA